MAFLNSSDRVQLIAMLRSHFSEIVAEIDGGFLPRTDQPDLEVMEQRELSLERIAELQDQITSNIYGQEIRMAAARLTGGDCNSLLNLPTDRVADVCQGVARAEIERLRYFVHRLTDRLTPYSPTDVLFLGPQPTVHAVSDGIQSCASPAAPSIKTVVEIYLTAGKERWTQKTYAGKRKNLSFLIEHIGPDTAITAVTPAMIRSYKSAIGRLRSNHHAGTAKSFAEKQTCNEKHRIAPETVLNIYNPARAFFAWATEIDGHLTSNPAANIRIEAAKKMKGKKSRRPFNANELMKLFSAPIFLGCASPNRRFTAGATILRDDNFWIPVLGYYTGARLGEIVQLHLGDVNLTGPNPYIAITEEMEKAFASKHAKHVKSQAGIRQIPLHPDILALGFGEFVARRQKLKRSLRLFYQIKLGADGQASTNFSKWFARLLDKQELQDPSLTFHSLRHGVQDALRDAKQPQYIIDRIFGHSSGTTASQYGTGASLDVLADAIKSMKLPIRLTKLWPVKN